MSVQFGCIGTGKWGSKVIKAIRDLGFDCLTCNRNGEFEGVKVDHTDHKLLIKQSDVVFIATHPETAFNLAWDSIQLGKSTIVEKPCTLSSRNMRSLYHLALSNNTSLFVDYVHLFNHDIESMKGTCFRYGSVELGGAGPIRDYSAMYDYGSHAVAIALFLCVHPIVKISFPNQDQELVELQFANGQWINILASNKREEKFCNITLRDADGAIMRQYIDQGQKSPLQNLIASSADRFLMGQVETNGDLATLVAETLERIHKLMPKV